MVSSSRAVQYVTSNVHLNHACCSYMPLVQQLDKSRPVYVLDDGVMTSGRAFTFTSIEQVAQTCVSFVEAIASTHSKRAVTLGGWSYGGVVASAVAKLLAQRGSKVEVRSLVLFDAPLRAPRKPTASGDGVDQNSEGVSGTAPAVINPAGAGGQAALDLEARTQAHFRACTDLLQRFYASQQPQQEAPAQLQCSVCDVRPEHTDYDCGVQAAQELTTGAVRRVTVPGTHWTMLFNSNAVEAAKAIRDCL
jgi:thioesterase domain-containing protein